MHGLRDREAGTPMRADTLFRIYSMSKVVTGVATLIAMEQGLFRLDEPVSKYLPELAEPARARRSSPSQPELAEAASAAGAGGASSIGHGTSQVHAQERCGAN